MRISRGPQSIRRCTQSMTFRSTRETTLLEQACPRKIIIRCERSDGMYCASQTTNTSKRWRGKHTMAYFSTCCVVTGPPQARVNYAACLYTQRLQRRSNYPLQGWIMHVTGKLMGRCTSREEVTSSRPAWSSTGKAVMECEAGTLQQRLFQQLPPLYSLRGQLFSRTKLHATILYCAALPGDSPH